MIDRTRFSSALAGLVAVASLGSTGCLVHGRYKPLAYAANGAMVIAGGVLLHEKPAMCTDTVCPQAPNDSIATQKLMGGTLLALGALGIALTIASDDSPESAAPLARTPYFGDDVRQITEDARAAARADACIDVRDDGRRVFHLDPPYYENVFKRDHDIKSCL